MDIFDRVFDKIVEIIEIILHKLGMKIPFAHHTKKTKTFFKFAIVGVTGTIIDFLIYKFLINKFAFSPATARAFSYEVAIFNNFFLNNLWTFKSRKTNTSLLKRLGLYNLITLGGLVIGVVVTKVLHSIYGDGFLEINHFKLAFNTIYFLITIPPITAWNFTVNHFITWRQKNQD